MKFTIFICLLLCFSIPSQAQNAVIENNESKSLSRNVGFSHQPLVVLRLNPLPLFRFDNYLQYGIEVAPPVGKFSFVFDYGRGKGKSSILKNAKKNYPNNTTRMIHAEVRTYFSDWYPFYLLDKKPFGRYYALEYVGTTYNRFLNLRNDDPEAPPVSIDYREKRTDIRVKFGKHIILAKHFFIDVYGGIGMGFYKANNEYGEETLALAQKPDVGMFSKKRVHMPGEKGIVLSPTLGTNLLVPF
ncbi:MAG: hypothetical protein ACRCVT_01605 [Leadbetterella sp.]